jgi:catechol 2,3-dioxygenase-like lactoylglutathione lyase family enzyme
MTVHIEVVGVVVDDMARALAFYRRLGFAVPDDADTQPHVEAALPGGLRIAFDTADIIRSFDPEWKAPSGGHRIALAFACDTVDEVDATYQDLVGAGYEGHLEPWDAVWGMRYAVIHDPDGNSVELFASVPASATS